MKTWGVAISALGAAGYLIIGVLSALALAGETTIVHDSQAWMRADVVTAFLLAIFFAFLSVVVARSEI